MKLCKKRHEQRICLIKVLSYMIIMTTPPVVPTVIMSNPPTLIGVIVKTILLSTSLVLYKDDTDQYLAKK